MKALFCSYLMILFSQAIFAQCPTAGSDTSAIYCKNETFDVADLRSTNASLGGAFIDPMGDTMTSTSISLPYPGQYTFYYRVSDTSMICPNDTAKYVIMIENCWPGGLSELASESHSLAYPNPASNQLTLTSTHYEQVQIFDASGRCVLNFSAPLDPVIDLTSLKRGTYFLLLEKDGIKQFQRFLRN